MKALHSLAQTVLDDLWTPAQPKEPDELPDFRQVTLPTESISPNPEQPRGEIDEGSESFCELVASIRANGLLQPVAVFQPDPSVGQYTLVAGERRWRAFRKLSNESPAYKQIPALVITNRDENQDAVLLLQGFSENMTRHDLNPAECAAAVARLRELTGWTYDTIASHLGMTTQRVHMLAAIGANEPVRAALADGQLTQAQAAGIARKTSDPTFAQALIEAASAARTTVRTAKAVKTKGRATVGDVECGVTPPPEVDIDKLPIARLVGGGMTPREEIYAAVARTCLCWGGIRRDRHDDYSSCSQRGRRARDEGSWTEFVATGGARENFFADGLICNEWQANKRFVCSANLPGAGRHASC